MLDSYVPFPLPFYSDFKTNNVILLLYTKVNISIKWVFSYITGMLLPYLTKLTAISWYHQIPTSCKNFPIVSHLSSFTIGLFDEGPHTVLGSYVP